MAFGIEKLADKLAQRFEEALEKGMRDGSEHIQRVLHGALDEYEITVTVAAKKKPKEIK